MSYQSIAIGGGPACRVVEDIFDAEHGRLVILDRWPFGSRSPGSFDRTPAVLVDHSGAEVRATAFLIRSRRELGMKAESARVELRIRMLDA